MSSPPVATDTSISAYEELRTRAEAALREVFRRSVAKLRGAPEVRELATLSPPEPPSSGDQLPSR